MMTSGVGLRQICDWVRYISVYRDSWDEAALEAERDFYSGYDYTLMNSQEDYDDDSLAEQLLYEKYCGDFMDLVDKIEQMQ